MCVASILPVTVEARICTTPAETGRSLEIYNEVYARRRVSAERAASRGASTSRCDTGSRRAERPARGDSDVTLRRAAITGAPFGRAWRRGKRHHARVTVSRRSAT